MICPACSCKIKDKPKKEPYNYSPIFLNAEVIIENAKRYVCKDCNTSFLDLGDCDEIDKNIASKLLDKDIISRSQARWLRICFFKLKIPEMAKALKTSSAHVLNMEAFRSILGPDMSDCYKKIITLQLTQKRLLVTNGKKRIDVSIF